MKKLYYLLMIVFGIVSFDVLYVHAKSDISRMLDLEDDNNDNDDNLSIPNLGGQMSTTPNAFDSFNQEDVMVSVANGAQDDLDTSVPGIFKNLRRNNPLMLAVLDNDLLQAKKLVKKSNVNYQNKDGQTALHYAVLYDHNKFLNLLLNNQAQVNIKDKLGRTPLHGAAQNDTLQAAKRLIESGADRTIQDNNDKSPADYAQSLEMIDLLT